MDRNKLKIGDLVYIPQCTLLYKVEQQQILFFLETKEPVTAVYLEDLYDGSDLFMKVFFEEKTCYVKHEDVNYKY